MRVDPAAALQAALLGLLKGGKEQRPLPAFTAAADAAAPPATPALGGAQQASSVAMLVAMAAQAPGLHRAPALKRAERGIDALGRLHRLLLAGAVPVEALEQLHSWSLDQEGAGDEMAGLLREVELRILVELAKAGR